MNGIMGKTGGLHNVSPLTLKLRTNRGYAMSFVDLENF